MFLETNEQNVLLRSKPIVKQAEISIALHLVYGTVDLGHESRFSNQVNRRDVLMKTVHVKLGSHWNFANFCQKLKSTQLGNICTNNNEALQTHSY